MMIDYECTNCKKTSKLNITEVYNSADAKRIANHDELLEALKGMISWTKHTAIYHLKDEEILPKGFEKWESLIDKAARGNKGHV